MHQDPTHVSPAAVWGRGGGAATGRYANVRRLARG